MTAPQPGTCAAQEISCRAKQLDEVIRHTSAELGGVRAELRAAEAKLDAVADLIFDLFDALAAQKREASRG